MAPSVEWLNQNRYRKYPFVEDGEPLVSGSALPDNLLLDLRLIVHTEGLAEDAFGAATVSFREFERVDASNTILKFNRNAADSVEFTVTIPTAAAFPYEARTSVNTTTERYDLICVVGEGFATLLGYGLGTHTVSGGDLEPTTVQYQTNHRVTSIIGDNALSVPIDGDIYFQEGYGMAVNVDAAQDQIRLTAYPGGGAGFPCDSVIPDPYVDIILTSTASAATTVSTASLGQPEGTIVIDGITFRIAEGISSSSSGGSSAGSTSAGSTSAGSTSAGSTSVGSTSVGSTSSGSTSTSASASGSTGGAGGFSVSALDILLGARTTVGEVFVAWEDDPESTLLALADAIALAIPDADVEYYTGPPGIAYIRVTRDNLLVFNTSESADYITLSFSSNLRLDCNHAISYINDVSPDGYGNIQLVGGKGIAVRNDPSTNTIYVRNRLNTDNIACGECEGGAPNA